MRRRTVVLDACVLVPIRLTTTVLWLAEAGLFEPLWSDPILEEVERALPKVGRARTRQASGCDDAGGLRRCRAGRRLRQPHRTLRQPRMSMGEFLAGLTSTAPGFADLASTRFGEPAGSGFGS